MTVKLTRATPAAIAVLDNQRFEVWVEGDAALDGKVPEGFNRAKLIGSIMAPDFNTACSRVVAREYSVKSVVAYFDPKRLTMWGTKLYPTEAEARKRNG